MAPGPSFLKVVWECGFWGYSLGVGFSHWYRWIVWNSTSSRFCGERVNFLGVFGQVACEGIRGLGAILQNIRAFSADLF